MPVWRCPHCGTPQAEAARCWVCRRSSTSCATCVNFRHAVFGGVGYCGLDRGRSALVGDEIRSCWVAPRTLMAEAVAFDIDAGERLAPDEQPFASGTETDPLTSDQPTRFWIEIEAQTGR